MKCYYEELGIARDANVADIKTAYRKLALRWHPDKNPDCLEDAKKRFLLIQQAYEVLSDAHERAWYDNHREQILRGKNSDYQECCLDLFQYFTSSCFSGYGDDEKGFYAVYREVFNKLISEDAEFIDHKVEVTKIPTFGTSQSSYEKIVGPFYAHWQSYCTKKTFEWLCPYDVQEIKDRRILREIEKNMKKVSQKAKKKRNEEVRQLVAFIRKRDKRVQAFKMQLEYRAAANLQKQQQNRINKLQQRRRELEEVSNNLNQIYNEGYEELLKQLEKEYDSDSNYKTEKSNKEEGSYNSEQKDNINNQVDELYCVSCNKSFKNKNSFANHEASKKHQDFIEIMRQNIVNSKDEEIESSFENICNESIDSLSEVEENEKNALKIDSNNLMTKNKKSKSKNVKKNFVQTSQTVDNELKDETIETVINNNNFIDNIWDNDKTKNEKRKNRRKKPNKSTIDKKAITNDTPELVNLKSVGINIINCELIIKNEISELIAEHKCAVCNAQFESKNKLFSHLKLTNHSVYQPKSKMKSVKNASKINN